MCMRLEEKLTELTGIEVTERDYDEWLEPMGDGDADKFDKAVLKLMGDELYFAASQSARLETLLFKMLTGHTFPMDVDGVTFYNEES